MSHKSYNNVISSQYQQYSGGISEFSRKKIPTCLNCLQLISITVMRIADLVLKKNGNRYSQIEIQHPSFQ